ncbi:hypothetical protein DFJ74DRAFT_764696 [Hyaloraphidium curvatum]|nr:hypothetical protein DFJ74DRAFT_764696 [Hyaloraphidium curvatum]
MSSSSSASSTAASAIPPTASFLHRLASGDVLNNPHPLHPMLVHVPLAFFLTAFGADGYAKLMGKMPGQEIIFGGSGLAIGPFSYWMHVLAVATAVPAALTGLAEYFNIQGKRDTAFTHALLNVTALSISLFNIAARRGRPSFEPTAATAMASMTGFAGALYSAYLGGTMVYAYGTGVKRQGSAAGPGNQGFVGARGREVGEQIVGAAKNKE